MQIIMPNRKQYEKEIKKATKTKKSINKDSVQILKQHIKTLRIALKQAKSDYNNAKQVSFEYLSYDEYIKELRKDSQNEYIENQDSLKVESDPDAKN